MKLMHEQLRSYSKFIANLIPLVVIIRLDRIIQSFPLDCPIKSGNDGMKSFKNLSLPSKRS
ncbi:MAG: hypothetical protein A2Y81_00710 [Nitrospirae bacterium RBG_13_43_8]|nr:MAG: hypothetical protein A2Y81_00710 [Nitrospirae bacterium RBG_13_43_8]